MKRDEGIRPLRILMMMLGLLLLAGLLGFSLIVWQDVKSSQLNRLGKQTESLLLQTQDFLNQQNRLISRAMENIQPEPQAPFSRLNEALDYLLPTVAGASALAWLDANGSLLVTVSRDNKTPSLSSDNRRILDVVRLDKRPQLGSMQRPSLLEPALLPYFIPLLDDRRQLKALITLYYPLGRDEGLLKHMPVPQGSRVWLVDREGQVRLSYPQKSGLVAGLFRQQLPEETLLAVQSQLKTDTATGYELEISGESLLVQAAYLPDYQMVLLLGQPVGTLYSAWARQMRPVAGIFLLFLLAAMLAYWVSSRISHKAMTARKLAEGNVEKLSKAVEQSPSSIVITDADWRIEYANNHFDLENSVAHLQRDALGQSIINFSPYSELKPDLATICEEVRQTGKWFAERQTEFNSRWYAFSVSGISNTEQETTHYVTVVNDITKRKEDEEKLYRQANFDSLTGLPNRLRGNKDLARALQEAWQKKCQIAVLYLDIDNFKVVNDTFGHLMGDQLLQLVADRLVKACRDRAYVCHVSGDEFMVYATYHERQEVQQLAEKILRDVETPVDIEGKQIFVSISIGIACYPDDNNDVSGLIKFSDIALYESKKQGRNRFSFFTSELEQSLKRKSEVENLLRLALERGEIYMVYQSKNCIQTGRILGFEALMRWQSADLGPVSPVEFISAAEEVGLINELGEFALRQACSDLVILQQASDNPLSMAVNLSLRQLAHDDIVHRVDEVLSGTDIRPEQLELEITESLLADNVEALLPRLERLLALGTSLTIDDFGTGYSSLSYLTRFPVSCLKVDRAFVRDMAYYSGDATLARTIIAMAHALDLKVVAEGIEDDTQLEMLRQYRCDIGQGYLFSKPLPLPEAVALLEAESGVAGTMSQVAGNHSE